MTNLPPRSLTLFAIAACFCCSMPPTVLAQDAFAWRNTQNNQLFRIDVSPSNVRIIPLGSVAFSADLPIKVDRKGRNHIMGIWQNGSRHGFFLINVLSGDTVAGYALVPQNVASADSCNSRLAGVVANAGGASQNILNCAREQLIWRRENITVQQAINEFQPQSEAPVSSSFIQEGTIVPAANSTENPPLAGVWVSEVSSAVFYKRIELTLRADGTYTKTLTARTSGAGGAGTVGAPSLGGTQEGRWTADGLIVHLSGDGNWPASDHNLAEFHRVQ